MPLIIALVLIAIAALTVVVVGLAIVPAIDWSRAQEVGTPFAYPLRVAMDVLFRPARPSYC